MNHNIEPLQYGHDRDDMYVTGWNDCYAAIEADRQRQGEVVVTKTPEGEIIAVTRQDDEGKILSVIAEADRKGRGEPVAVIRYERNTPGRENEMPRVISCNRLPDGDYPVFTVPQPADPVKVPSNTDIDELSREWGLQSAAYPSKSMVRDFARALLARYGQPAQPAASAETVNVPNEDGGEE